MFFRFNNFLVFSLFMSISTSSFGVAVNDTISGSALVCNAGSSLNASENDSCRATPTVYKLKVYEMGFCTAHPYGAAKTANLFDTASCVVTYTDASPAFVDIAASIGGSVDLAGTSTPPALGTYTHAYMLMDKTFNVSAEITNQLGTPVRYISQTGGAGVAASAAGVPQEKVETLIQFDEGASCKSGYIGATVQGGTMDGFVADAAKERGVSADNDGTNCTTHIGRVVGVMNLNTPINVTPKTFSVSFSFVVTNNGVQWHDGGGSTKDQPDSFSNAPFSGYFTVLDSD
jgi:hypothetical protein